MLNLNYSREVKKMSVKSRIRKIEKKKGIYKRRKEDIIKCKFKKQEKELSIEEMTKKWALTYRRDNE